MTNTGHTLSSAGSILQVLCVCCMLLCVAVDLGDAAKPRCGVELIAALEFVCGERGIYLGRVGGPRYGGSRSQGKGIVEQCCVKGCDLQHLEMYCAKPKRGRRHAPLRAQQIRADQFQRVFLRRYYKLYHELQELTYRDEEYMLYQENLRSTLSPLSQENIHKPEIQNGRRTAHLRTFIPHSLHS